MRRSSCWLRPRILRSPASITGLGGLVSLTTERQRDVEFVGCTALLARLDQLLIADRADLWIVVTCGPGRA
jgi:hypothetical protein